MLAGSTLAQVDGFSWCKKSTAFMSYNYASCKRSLEYLFGLVAIGKIILREAFHASLDLRLDSYLWKELWFQQDGATCHTARATIDLLKDTFGDRLISRFGPVNWPPRSCDLTPLDYFLWGYVKSLVYADIPHTLDHLEDNIRRVIADIRPQMLEKVIENWTSRLDYVQASRGSPMPEIIFKM
ncbi:heat shock 70kDa protein 8 [Trichonephila clavipes]|nr:heat shock 70kDa protein 8 [Trichonephila clavipes]